MDIRELKYIQAIGQTHHMAHAAQQLYITQPALFKTLKKVENEIGSKLFYKSGNELYPTEAGKIVLSNAEQIFSQMDTLLQQVYDLQDLKSGQISIGFPSIVGTMFLPEPLIQFNTAYPNIKLKTTEAGGFDLVNMVTNNKLDLAIVMRPIHSDVLNELPLVSDMVTFNVFPNHPMADKRFISEEDLKDIPFITFNDTFNMQNQLMDRLRQKNIRPNIVYDGANCEFLHRLSKMSNTALILPRPIVRYYDESLINIPFSPLFPWELCLIFKKNDYISNAVKHFIQHLQKYFYSNL